MRSAIPAQMPLIVRFSQFKEFDLAALGRILLRNPAWVSLAAAGRLDEIHDYRKADEETYF